MKTYLCDAEVAELMAGGEESLPTEEQEKEAIEVQRDTPLSVPEYYQEMGADHCEEYKRVTFDVDVFPKSLVDCIPKTGIVDSKITINRYLSSGVSIVMYRLMESQWSNIIRETSVSMVASLYFDLSDRYSYHEWCVPEESKENCTVACMKIVDFDNFELSAYIADNIDMFFCHGCDRSIVYNFCNWSAKMCSIANAALCQKNVITTLYSGDDIKFELQVKYDAIMKTMSSAEQDVLFDSPLPDSCVEPVRKRQKTNE